MGDYFVCSKTDPVVETKAGKVRGFRLNTTDAVHGIHYAEADRFQMPQPVKPWKGIKNALAYGYVCPLLKQDEPNMEVLVPHRYWPQDEHCQNLNVWTQSLDPGAKKPVMVWLHGGGFSAGSAIEHVAYEGDHLSEFGDVVVVSVNHRLNILGYLDLSPFGEKYKNSANAGNADMVAALQWVHDNIAAFGGDPDNVTVFGQSAGAGSVQTLISSPLAKGLINKAIIQSGGGLGGIIAATPLKDAEARGKSMWDGAGMTTLEQMRACPASKFDEVLGNYMRQQKTFGGLPYGPCIDGTLLEDSSDNVAKSGNEMDIPYMIGYVSEDIAPQVMKKAAVDWSLLLESQGRRPAYVYCFSRDLPGEDTMQSGGFGDMKGAFHSSELWYVFGTLGRCWRPMEQHDYDLSAKMVEYWTNFAKNGNPDGEGLPEWKPCVEGNEFIMEVK